MREGSKLIKGPVKVEKFGIAIRLIRLNPVKAKVSETFRECIVKRPFFVEFAPLSTDGTYATGGDCLWTIFGGSVGFSESTFPTLEKATEFFEDVLKLSSSEMVKKYPTLWVE